MDLSRESSELREHLSRSWARAKARQAQGNTGDEFFRFDEASCEETRVFSEELGSSALQNISESLEKMALTSSEVIQGKLPEIIGQANVPDYVIARQQQEEQVRSNARADV